MSSEGGVENGAGRRDCGGHPRAAGQLRLLRDWAGAAGLTAPQARTILQVFGLFQRDAVLRSGEAFHATAPVDRYEPST